MYVIDGDIDVEGTDEMLQEIPERFLDLPRVKHSVTTKSACFRELLKELKSLAYIVYNEEATTSLQETLDDALEEFKKATVNDNGIPAEGKVIIEKTKDVGHCKKGPAKDNLDSEEQHQKTLKIPIRKGKQNAYSGRVGISSDIKKTASKLDINDYLKIEEELTEFVEPVYEDLYDLDNYQSRINENNDPTWETQIVHNQVKSTEKAMSNSNSDDDSDLPISSASLASDCISPNMSDKIPKRQNI